MSGAKQPHPFDPAKAARLDDPAREEWLPTPVLLDLLGESPGARILDFGTGTGRYAIAAARRFPGAHVVGYDAQDAMAAIARERARSSGLTNVEIVSGMPAPDGPFDRILAVNVLHEMDDGDVRAMLHRLAPDGFAVIVDWDAALDRTVGPPREHVHDVAEAVRRIERAGGSAERLARPEMPNHFVLTAQER